MSSRHRQAGRATPGIVQRLVDAAAAQPVVFDALRWILEAGYRGEKSVLRQEGVLTAGHVLDLGCGTGALAGLFPVASYDGIDPNPSYIERARRMRPAHRFAVMDGRRLEFTPGSFDAVVIAGVVHHLADDDAFAILAQAKRVLKPGVGRLVMWEDIPTLHAWNVVGKLVHRLDEGDHIRPADHYLAMVESAFGAVRSYTMSSGVCDYVVMVGQRS
jgi:ubiquinone/menaquinone biosynthesis C-methylase UbiE